MVNYKYYTGKKAWHLARRQLLSSQMSHFYAVICSIWGRREDGLIIFWDKKGHFLREHRGAKKAPPPFNVYFDHTTNRVKSSYLIVRTSDRKIMNLVISYLLSVLCSKRTTASKYWSSFLWVKQTCKPDICSSLVFLLIFQVSF